MNGRVGVVHAFMIAAVNKALDDGFQVADKAKLPDLLIKQPRIRMFEKYLFIDAQPVFPKNFDPTHPLVKQIR